MIILQYIAKFITKLYSVIWSYLKSIGITLNQLLISLLLIFFTFSITRKCSKKDIETHTHIDTVKVEIPITVCVKDTVIITKDKIKYIEKTSEGNVYKGTGKTDKGTYETTVVCDGVVKRIDTSIDIKFDSTVNTYNTKTVIQEPVKRLWIGGDINFTGKGMTPQFNVIYISKSQKTLYKAGYDPMLKQLNIGVSIPLF